MLPTLAIVLLAGLPTPHCDVLAEADVEAACGAAPVLVLSSDDDGACGLSFYFDKTTRRFVELDIRAREHSVAKDPKAKTTPNTKKRTAIEKLGESAYAETIETRDHRTLVVGFEDGDWAVKVRARQAPGDAKPPCETAGLEKLARQVESKLSEQKSAKPKKGASDHAR